jgi:hypothetical protein
MSEVINPPEYYFTSIDFNSTFYETTNGSLTQTQANALYLQKTVPDTATAKETFLADINCEGGIFLFDSIAAPNAILALESFPDDPTIQLTNSLGTMSINSNSMEVEASRTLNIGTNTNIDLNVGTGSRTISGQVHHYSDGDNCVAGAGVHLNNGTNNNSATNIHNGTGANPSGIVNIMTGASNSGTVNIGATGTTTTINGTAKTNTLDGIATTGTQGLYTTKTSGTLNIATGQTSGNINIGASGSSLAINATNVTISNGTDVFIAGPLAVGATNKNAIANFIGTSAQPVSIACRPHNSNTTSLIDFYSVAGANRGSVLGTGASNVAYQTSSDRRLKTNIEPLDPMLDKVMSLKPSKYNWKEDNTNGYGFIAQEVYELFPQLRNRTPQMCGCIDEPVDEDGKPIHYGLDYGQFTPYIVKAVQELKQDYDTKLKFQETKFANLEARLFALETKPPHVEATVPSEPHETVIV